MGSKYIEKKLRWNKVRKIIDFQLPIYIIIIVMIIEIIIIKK